jgi:hypothetical protein
MAKNKDIIKFEDEIGEILVNLIKDTKRKKLSENVWRGLVGEETYKISIRLEDSVVVGLNIEKR